MLGNTPSPPYALSVPGFRLRALATLAGRAPLGGEREVALACFMAARLVAAALPPQALPAAARAVRAVGARLWLASLAIPAALRLSTALLLEASTDDDQPAMGAALAAVARAAAGALDPAALAELQQLVEELCGSAAAP